MLSAEINKTKLKKAFETVVVFDRSTCGKLLLKGCDRIDLLNRLCATDLRSVKNGTATYALLTTEKAKTIDLLFYMHSENDSLLLTGPGNQQKVMEWINKYTFTEDFTVEDVTDKYNILLLAGKNNEKLLKKLGVDTAKEEAFIDAEIRKIPVRLFKDMYGINFMTETNNYCPLNKTITAYGSEFELTDIDEPVFDSYRIYYVLPFFGKEIREEFNPMESGLMKYISFTKGCYPGQEVIARLDSQDKVRNQIAGIIFEADLPDDSVEEIEIFSDNQKIGKVTTIGYSLKMEKMTGICIINKNSFDSEKEVRVKTKEIELKARLTNLPFCL